MTVEKNDVDISKLFVWGKKFEIKDGKDVVLGEVWMRLLGDADINRARVFAIRKSRELRLKLLDPNSEERLIYVQSPQELTKEDLINYVVMFSMRDISNSAYKDVKVGYPKEPKSSAKLEVMEKYQNEVDEYPGKVSEAIKKYITNEVEKLKVFLQKETEETLHKKYVTSLIEEFCEQEALRAYNDMEVFLGTYKDSEYSERVWKSFDDFDNLEPNSKQSFKDAYRSLNFGMDELKKLREATQ